MRAAGDLEPHQTVTDPDLRGVDVRALDSDGTVRGVAEQRKGPGATGLDQGPQAVPYHASYAGA